MTHIRTVRPRAALWPALALLTPLALAGCEVSKSANPTSPSVAGPIAGVTITAPVPIQPANNATVQNKDQPVTLMIGGATTTGQRPLALRVQVSGQSDFSAILFSQENVTQATSGQTKYVLPTLQAGHSYFWRVQADDGANKSPWSSTVSFDVVLPTILGVPVPISPVGNVRVSTSTPDFVVTNGTSSGPHTQIFYQFVYSPDPTFAQLTGNAQVPEGDGGQTHYTPRGLPSADTVYYWRARMYESVTTGDWSRTESFQSPAAPAPPAPPPPGSSPPPPSSGSCDSLVNDKPALVACIHATINPGSSATRAFEVTKRVAWALRGEGAGLLIKNGGENIIAWRGYSFSLSRICYPDGHIYKVLSDAGEGGTNGPTWSDNDFVDRSLYVPAIDPSLPEPDSFVEDFTIGGWLNMFTPEAALPARRPHVVG